MSIFQKTSCHEYYVLMEHLLLALILHLFYDRIIHLFSSLITSVATKCLLAGMFAAVETRIFPREIDVTTLFFFF